MALDDLLVRLQADYDHITVTAGQHFCWAPASREVVYNIDGHKHSAAWSLLHEFGHALLDHSSYESDFELVRLEVAAWHKARELAAHYGIAIDKDHIEDCLDTYRDWLHRRSICPTCGCQSLQRDGKAEYECFNCHTTWQVSTNRFSRAYRRTKGHSDNVHEPAPVFA